jgi:hypothetical protein
MSRTTTTTTALRTVLASAIVVSGIGAPTLGGAGADAHTVETPPVTIAAPARQESTLQAEPAAETQVLITETTIHTETGEQRDRAVWALGRFEEAGLELPPVEIHIHSDKSECNGLNGYLANAAGGGWVLHSCGVDFTLLHELAHAWDNHSLDDETRERFLGIAHADTWNNSENWNLAGGEHAANVIAWGLMDERINQTRTRPYDHNSMIEAYNILTGGEPLWMAS